MTPAELLEPHLAREFVTDYITRLLGGRKAAVPVDPAKVFFAARMAGLKVSSKTVCLVLDEMMG